MSGHRILTAAAAHLGISSSSAAIAASTPAPQPPAASQPGSEETVDVVTVTDAQAAVAAAETRGATAERTRTSAVLASDAGKANPMMAAWMLEHNASASADAIIAQLGTMPASAVAPAAAPAAGTTATAPAAPAAAAPAAITVPLDQTPKVEIAPNANSGGHEGMSQAEIDKLWDSGIQVAGASLSNNFGTELAPGIPRTGN